MDPGRRLSFSGALCTVRYVGPIDGTKGDWLGVEWDEPSRGKHDGGHEGVKYFECRSASSTAASFIRPSRPSDQSTSFFEALRNKYASASAEDIKATANQTHIGGKTVEEVGFEKIRRQLAELQDLQVVVLDGACIAAVDSDLDEQNLKIIELDLSRNLLENWYNITDICSSLHYLQSLRLEYVYDALSVSGISAHLESYSGNTLSRPQDPFKNNKAHGPYERVKELSLNNLGFLQSKSTGKKGNLSWQFIREFTAIFPSLETLSLASNNLNEITLPLISPLLMKLDLSFNAFTTLEHIRPLTALPNLQTLSLRANPLTSLSSPPGKNIVFPKLKRLDLISTLLPTLPSLNPIPVSFPGLTSLLTNHTPLTTYPSASLHTIARLATLTELNHSQITPPERQNAELYYLSQTSKQLAAATTHAEEREILEANPGWQHLCDIHGEPTVAQKTDAKATGVGTLAARVTEFTFYISERDLQTARRHAKSIAGHPSGRTEDADSDTTISHRPPGHDDPLPVIEKKKPIPRTVDVYRLKGIVGHLFNIRPMSMKLIWETEEWDPVGEGDGGWSVSEDESDDEERPERTETERGRRRGKKELWKKREMELVDGTREVGFFVEGTDARVRVELR